jgi:hypothetical protein
VRSLPRGTQQMAVCREKNILAIGWIDNKVAHFIPNGVNILVMLKT